MRGYAAMQLRDAKDLLDPSNRRISLIVHYLDAGNGASGSDDVAAKGVTSFAVDSLPANHPVTAAAQS